MFDLWYDLPPLLRALLSLAMIGVGVLLLFVGLRRAAIIIGGMGLVFLLFSGAGNDKNGYNF